MKESSNYRACFSCGLLGEDDKQLIAYADILKRNHYSIKFIISLNPKIKLWAQTEGLTCYDSPKQSRLPRNTVDYLFNFNLNKESLHASRVAKFTIFCSNSSQINHSKYAHYLAIIRKDKKYREYWWLSMGNPLKKIILLKSFDIPILKNETAFSLGEKAQVQAQLAFLDIILELKEKISAAVKMPAITNIRHNSKNTLSLKQTLENSINQWLPDTIIDWESKALDLERKFRALSFGDQQNPIGLQKILLGQDIVFFRNLRVLKSRSKTLPGTIISISSHELHISTATQNIALSDFYSLQQTHLSIVHLANHYDLIKGHCLPKPELSFIKKYAKNYSACLKHEAFWLKMLFNIIPGETPLSLSVKEIKKNHARMIDSSMIDSSVFSKMQTLADKEKTNTSVILLTAILIYFYRINNYQNFTVKFSNPYLNQYKNNLKDFFAAQVPLTTDFNPKLSFTQVLAAVINHLKQIRNYHSYARDIFLRYSGLAEENDSHLVSLVIVPDIHQFQLSRVDALTLVINQKGNEFALYSRENIFSPSVNAALVYSSQHITHLLRSVIENQEIALNKVSYLSASEYQQIFHDWNNTEIIYQDRDLPVHFLFEKQVAKTPHLIAVSFENRNLTYFELNQKANQVAQYLRNKGLSSGSIVGILAKRSLEMVIAILGILKSGAAYLPLDPNYPEERLQYMLFNSEVNILLTDSTPLSLKSHKEKPQDLQVKEIKEILAHSNARSQIYEVNHFSSEDSAYVIYTSGTTGKPKGVPVSHRSLVNHMLWMIPKFNFNENDIFLQKTPFSFDASVWEFFAPLLSGGKLIIMPNEMPLDYSRIIKKHGVTVLQLVPSLLRALLEENEFQFCHSLRQVFSGGEALPNETVNLFHKKMKAKLHNLYGPTEATIQMSTYSYPASVDQNSKAILIGKPISNTKCYVLDKYLNLMPVGVSGELYIGGRCLAKGYMNQETLTEERFIANPFEEQSGSRLYKTGDKVRFLPDGNLEYCGRLDEQVKLNGFRIEISEIESCIMQHESVSECVVVVQEYEPKNDRSVKSKSLLAFYVKKSGEINSDAQDYFRNWESVSNKFKEFLRTKLPSYMIPARFIPLEKLPLTVNGKLNKKALVEPEFNRSEGYVAPRNETEVQICKIWTEVLGMPEDKIGILDDFFYLGGHSLSALRTLSLIRNTFFITLPTRTLFDYPTIEQLAELILKTQTSTTDVPQNSSVSPVIILRKNEFCGPLFLIHPVGGTTFWYKALSRYLGDSRSIYAIQDPGIDAKDLLFKNVTEMASFYIKAIQEIQPSGSYYLAGASFGATVAIEMANQLLNSKERVNFIGLLDGQPVYSKKFWEKDFFERLMLQQFERMETQFINQGINDIQFLLKLHQHRMSMLRYYKIPVINAKLTYFKAEELWPVFKEMDLPLNCWQPYSSEPVDTYVVPGNHETMFWEPHVQVLAKKMVDALGKLTVNTVSKYKNVNLRLV